nr:hypothetical protein [Tanacetum cinerariifolium]
MKRSLQDRANDIELWEILKRKLEKSSTSNTSCRDDAFHSQHHDEHQDNDAPPEGEKRVKRQKTSKSSKSARGSLSKRSVKYSTTYVSKQQQQQEWDAWVEETIIDEDEVNLTATTLIFPGIEAHETYSIIEKTTIGELDRDIMRAFERDITKRLRHREQMRRWNFYEWKTNSIDDEASVIINP